MKKTHLVFVFLAAFCAVPVKAVVPTEEIAAIQSRTQNTEPSDSDKAGIVKFLRSALNAMFLSEDTEEIAKIRRQICEQKGKDLSRYSSAYLASAREQLRIAFSNLERVTNPARRLKMELHLMILTAELKSLMLTEFGAERVQHNDLVVRYWAVKSLTGKAILDQLHSEVSGDPAAADAIYKALAKAAETEKQPEILLQIINFSSQWNDDRGAGLLRSVAAGRMNMYKDWSVEQEWLEGPLLKALSVKYQQQKLPDNKMQTARTIAELAAMVAQRWMLGQEVLSVESKIQLRTVIIETDEQAFAQLQAGTNGRIKQAFEKKYDIKPLFEELLGSDTKQGSFCSRLGINYGPKAGGGTLTAPPKLSPPPAPAKDETPAVSTAG